MRTAGLTMSDVWAGRVLREESGTRRHDAVTAEISVFVDSVEFGYHGLDTNFRPYLHLTGELTGVRFAEPLAHGITEATYATGHGEKVDAYYEFDDEQLAVLAKKGYFTRAFRVPEYISGIEWELPATVDVLVLDPGRTPDGNEERLPVVFVGVRDVADLVVDLHSTGYDLTDYFEDLSQASAQGQQSQMIDERGLRARSDALNSLFHDGETSVDVPAAGHEEAAPAAILQEPEVSSRIGELEAALLTEREQHTTELARIEGTAENLYRSRVEAALHEADPRGVRHEQDAGGRESAESPHADLDFGEEEQDIELRGG